MDYRVRPARTSDVWFIRELVDPLVQRRILLGKETVLFFEAVQEFRVAEGPDGEPIGVGALHVMWEDIAEIRTLAVSPSWLRKGVGQTLLTQLETDARDLGLSRLFCLTFEVDFFARNGFEHMPEASIESEVYSQMVRSPDEGVAEFLDLARVKPNTLGNSRMIKHLN